MSFVGAIDQTNNLVAWSRAILALALVSDQIKLCISQDGLSLSAVNASKTAHGETSFHKLFFREFSFSDTSIAREGYDSGHRSYSAVVSAKHMMVLFKNLDAANVSYVCLKMECGRDVAPTRAFKVLVEILSKKMIVKKYQMAYQPVHFRIQEIPSVYKQDYASGKCNYLRAELATIKSFLDMVPVTTEDFKVEVKLTKLLLIAHTRQVLKDREFLKQPMLITILMALDDLQDTNLHGQQTAVNFRLKDFRNFVNVAMAVRDNTDIATDDDLLHDPAFDAFFKAGGDPIVFQHTSGPVTVTFVQITAGDSDHNGPSTNKSLYVLSGHVIHRAEEPEKTPGVVSVMEEGDDYLGDGSPGDMVTYGERFSNSQRGKKRARDEDQHSDTDYGTSGDEGMNDIALGPTQTENKPRSLFDWIFIDK